MMTKIQEYSRAWYQKNKVRIAKRARAWDLAHPKEVYKRNRKCQLKQRFNLTLEQYDEMLASQNGKCAICKSESPKGRGCFHVDHDHKTGRVRKLLCNNCNRGLGYFDDSDILLLEAARYLRSFSTDHKN